MAGESFGTVFMRGAYCPGASRAATSQAHLRTTPPTCCLGAMSAADPAASARDPARAARAAAPGRLRLRTLVAIRWAAVLGQAAAVLVVELGLGFELPLVPVATTI